MQWYIADTFGTLFDDWRLILKKLGKLGIVLDAKNNRILPDELSEFNWELQNKFDSDGIADEGVESEHSASKLWSL